MRTLFLFTLLLALISPSLWAQGLSDLRTEGSSTENHLAEDSFHKLRLVHLPDAKVLYINFAWLKERGIADLTNKDLLKKELIDNFAWVTEDLAPKQKTKDRIGLADFYGGTGMGTHLGSARAAIVGEVQIKGVGKTPVYSSFMDRIDDGRASFHEAIKEVVWGEHFNRSLPFGANRVIGLIDTGLKLSTGENHILILRENPLRAGHYVRRSMMTGPGDNQRVTGSVPKIDSQLIPHSERKLFLLNQLRRASLDDFIDHPKRFMAIDELLFRNSAQVARSYAYKLSHGAVSESNINLDGSFIDYGTASSNAGYGRIRFLSFGDAFGDWQETSKFWGDGLASSLLIDKELNLEQGVLLEILEKSWEHYLSRALRREFISLTGLPVSDLRRLETKHEFQDLGKSLVQLAQEAQGSLIDIQNEPMPELTGNFDLSKLLVLLAKHAGNTEELTKALSEFKALSESLRADLITQWTNLYKLATDKLSPPEKEEFDKGLIKEAERLNQNQPELYRDRLKAQTSGLMKEYNKSGNAEVIQSEIDSLIRRLEAFSPGPLSPFYGRPPYCRALFR